jgi:hypothetical protein
MREVARLVASASTPPVVVVSAMAGVTDRLTGIASSIRDGSQRWRELVPELRAGHGTAVADLTAGDDGARAALDTEVACAGCWRVWSSHGRAQDPLDPGSAGCAWVGVGLLVVTRQVVSRWFANLHQAVAEWIDRAILPGQQSRHAKVKADDANSTQHQRMDNRLFQSPVDKLVV